jgi:hypothetical protein
MNKIKCPECGCELKQEWILNTEKIDEDCCEMPPRDKEFVKDKDEVKKDE